MNTRFWSKVDVRGPDECWPWLAGAHSAGYGKFWYDGCPHYSHRIAVMLDGRDPTGVVVRHRCDNPPCCNPAHLDLGTYADNSRDCVERGRQARGDTHGSRTKPESRPRGEAHGRAKLTVADIKRIRADPRPQRVIAAGYDVTQALVSFIKSRRSWAHVE